MTMPKFEPVATAMVNQHGTRWMHWKANLAHGTNLHSADQLTEAFEAGKRAQASELEAARAEIERLKTVPMKYRRMAFNAQLQDENAKLNQQLAAEQAKNVGLLEALEKHVTELMNIAVSNGANSVSMPDDYVATALLLSETPEQSLAAYRNKVIEECAKRAEAYTYMSQNFNALAEELRAMKEQS